MPDRRQFLRVAGRSVAVAGLGAGFGFHGSPPAQLPSRRDDWESIRQQYDLWEARTYLNTGGLGPASRPVLQRFRETMDDLQRRSETGHGLIERARPVVADFFGADEKEIMFTRNATEGNAIVASGMRLQAGDEVIIDSHAHPGGAIPWLNRWKQDGIVVRTFDPSNTDGPGILQRIADQITNRTRIIQVSHVTAPTGILMPVTGIAALARDRGCWFHIDGAQSAGMLPIDLHAMGCDSWATSGHKWLGAPHGTGLLYIRADRLDDIRPTEVGAYSDQGYSLPDRFDYIDSARRHESGTRNAPLVVGLKTACEFMAGIGMDRVRQRGLDLTERLRTGLESVDSVEILTPPEADLHGSILTFRSTEMDFRQLYETISADFQLRIRIVTEADLNAVRISLHIFNNEQDADRVIRAVQTVLG